MNNTIENLQSVLQISDKYLADKLRITQRKLNLMKDDALTSDYRRIKSLLIDERCKIIKFLK